MSPNYWVISGASWAREPIRQAQGPWKWENGKMGPSIHLELPKGNFKHSGAVQKSGIRDPESGILLPVNRHLLRPL
jgi:hypothetical protein